MPFIFIADYGPRIGLSWNDVYGGMKLAGGAVAGLAGKAAASYVGRWAARRAMAFLATLAEDA